MFFYNESEDKEREQRRKSISKSYELYKEEFERDRYEEAKQELKYMRPYIFQGLVLSSDGRRRRGR